jgi:hypothetical protein
MGSDARRRGAGGVFMSDDLSSARNLRATGIRGTFFGIPHSRPDQGAFVWQSGKQLNRPAVAIDHRRCVSIC